MLKKLTGLKNAEAHFFELYLNHGREKFIFMITYQLANIAIKLAEIVKSESNQESYKYYFELANMYIHRAIECLIHNEKYSASFQKKAKIKVNKLESELADIEGKNKFKSQFDNVDVLFGRCYSRKKQVANTVVPVKVRLLN